MVIITARDIVWAILQVTAWVGTKPQSVLKLPAQTRFPIFLDFFIRETITMTTTMATTVFSRSASDSATILLPQIDSLQPPLPIIKGKKRMIVRMSTMDSSGSQSDTGDEEGDTDTIDAPTGDKDEREVKNIISSRGPRRISIVDPKSKANVSSAVHVTIPHLNNITALCNNSTAAH